ncbi:MAG TPA: FHA domain-containing protein [Kofleriaceae bacterium]|nr:FHA domain-containing protein [Kofleriaceae bacterium]
MGARVLFRDSHGRDGHVDLNPAAPLYVGRALDCAVRTDDAMVSRKHSMIRMENGRFYVEDLGSSNGTHVNDIRVTKHPLSHNDVVRCGSLWLRYVEDGAIMAGAPIAPPERPKGGTQRLEPADFGISPGAIMGGGGMGGGGMGGGGMGGGHGQMGSSTAQGQGASRSPGFPAVGAGARPIPGGPVGGGPVGGYPPGGQGGMGQGGMQGGIGHAGTLAAPHGGMGGELGQGGGAYPPGRQPPGMRAGGPAVGGGQPVGPGQPGGLPVDAYQLFGGPPAMPQSEGIVGGDLITPPRSSGPAIGDEDSIVVDMRDGDGARVRRELDEALGTVEKLQIAYDREVADGKRLRAEIVTHKDRTDELRRALVEREEVVEAHNRVSDELREELRQAKDSLAAARTQESELADLVAARERQLARSQEDMGQFKREIQDKERQLSEVSRTKDEGWRKLNEQLTEIEHLREVITQQERMLEERRVGLISQDQMIKELKADKDQHLRDVAHLKAERDELRSAMGRLNAQVSAIDEENRRLTQLLTDLRAKRGGPGEDDHAAAAHTAAATAEVKSLRIALKTVESDRDHLKQLSERAETEVDRLRERLTKVEVDLREALDDRDRAQAGKSVSEDATTRAELARHKAAEEAVMAARARDDRAEQLSEVQRELDKARRRVAELEDDTQSQGVPVEAVIEENRRLERKVAEGAEALAAAEGELRTARAEMEVARRRPTSTRQQAVEVPDGDDVERTAVVSFGRNPAKIKDRAIEVHDGINDVLSELRNNAMILNEEFLKGPSERSPESSRIMKDAIEALLGQAEEAKGVLRSLRELVEFPDE